MRSAALAVAAGLAGGLIGLMSATSTSAVEAPKGVTYASIPSQVGGQDIAGRRRRLERAERRDVAGQHQPVVFHRDEAQRRDCVLHRFHAQPAEPLHVGGVALAQPGLRGRHLGRRRGIEPIEPLLERYRAVFSDVLQDTNGHGLW